MEKKEIVFQVKGSAPKPYTVRFINRGGGNLSAYCDCPAGQNGLYCKHRFSILRGDPKGVIKGKDSIPTVREWAKGSDIERTINLADAAEARMKEAEKIYKQALKEFEHQHEELLERDTPNRRTKIEKARLKVIESLDAKAETKAAYNYSKKKLLGQC